MSMTRTQVLRSAAALFVLLGFASGAQAGPPLICHPFDAGTAPLLPWAPNARGWNSPDPSYDLKKLTADTLRLLSPDAPILARMENMRRATIYASKDRAIAAELLVAVMGRALTEAGRGSHDALAWFDAGYLVESYRQASGLHQWSMLGDAERATGAAARAPRRIDGYAWVKQALDLTGPNPEIEFAASLIQEGPLSAEHRRRAVAGAKAGSLLAKNLQK